MKTMAGWLTSSTAMVRRLRCSALRPLEPSMPTMLSLMVSSSTSDMICARMQWVCSGGAASREGAGIHTVLRCTAAAVHLER